MQTNVSYMFLLLAQHVLNGDVHHRTTFLENRDEKTALPAGPFRFDFRAGYRAPWLMQKEQEVSATAPRAAE